MPNFDGTGPLGRGPLSGRGLGYCVLRELAQTPGRIEGWAGIDGVPVGDTNSDYVEQAKEVTAMPRGDGTGPVGAGPMTGRAAGFCAGAPVPGYRNPGVSGSRQVAPYRTPMFGVGSRFAGRPFGWFSRWIRGGFGLGRGFGWGRGRGRGRRGGQGGFGYW